MSTKSGTTLTPRDIELLLAALKSSKTEFAVDYPKFAQEAGLTLGSAKTMWSALKKKLEKYRGDSENGGDETAKASPAKGMKRKSVGTPAADDEEGEATPTGKKAKRAGKTASPAKEEGDAEEKKASEDPRADSPVKAEPED